MKFPQPILVSADKQFIPNIEDILTPPELVRYIATDKLSNSEQLTFQQNRCRWDVSQIYTYTDIGIFPATDNRGPILSQKQGFSQTFTGDITFYLFNWRSKPEPACKTTTLSDVC